MVVEGNENEGKPGYEEFDSSEFEADQPEGTETKTSDVKTEATPKHAEGEKLTAEEAFGGGDESEKTEATTEETTEGVKADDASAKVEESTYEPDFKYKSYGQEKEFPEQLRSIVKDKESEEFVRTLLSKADGLDEMKPRHQETIQQRDDYKSQVDFFKKDINRVLTLRDKNPHLFAAELSITDDWIIDRAKEIVNAKESPELYTAFKTNREKEFDLYTRELVLQNQQHQINNSSANDINAQVQAAMSDPQISQFAQQFDAMHGQGAFQGEVMKHGYYHYERTKQAGKPENLAPLDAARQMFEFHKKSFAPAAPQGEVKTAPASTKPNTVVVKEKPQALPNVGKGRAASPVKQGFKNLKQMRDYVQKHVPSDY